MNGHSRNYTGWQVVDLAVQAYGFCSVSLYDTLGKDAVGAYITYIYISRYS